MHFVVCKAMPFVKKANTQARNTRSRIVRLEHVLPSDSTSPELSTDRKTASPNNFRNTRTISTTMGATSKMVSHDEKKYKGPLKKRPINSQSPPQQQQQQQMHQQQQHSKDSLNTTSNVRPNQKIKIIERIRKIEPEDRYDSPPPTIAAGRSRRAIKPNPKYASEDLVTPKMIRNVGGLPSANKSSQSMLDGKQRKPSTSSDDFFNHDSSEDMDMQGFGNVVDTTDDKLYHTKEKDNKYSVFSETEVDLIRTKVPRGRGRPRKTDLSTTSTLRKSSVLGKSSQSTSTTTGVRSTPAHIQGMRRSLVSSNTRNINLLTGHKRKLENSPNDEDNDNAPVVHKKMMISSTGMHLNTSVRDSKENAMATSTPVSQTKIIRKLSGTSQTLNGNKVLNSQISSASITANNSEQRNLSNLSKSSSDNRTIIRTNTTRSLSNTSISNKTVNNSQSLTTQAKILAARATAAACRSRSAPGKYQVRSTPQPSFHKNNIISTKTYASSTSSEAINKSNTSINQLSNQKSNAMITLSTSKTNLDDNNESIATAPSSSNSTNDDFEAMPTFTIVNVNDIINKKGDVLIKKSRSSHRSEKDKVTELVKADSVVIDENENENARRNNEVDTLKQPRVYSRVVAKRQVVSKLSSTDSSQKNAINQPHVLNHKLGLRNSFVSSVTKPTTSTTLEKPAPRILNALVGKKMQPVKSLIANIDDSNDESIPLSLSDDDEDESISTMTDLRKSTADTDSQTTTEIESHSWPAVKNNKNNVYANKSKIMSGKSPIVLGNRKKVLTSPSMAAKDNQPLSNTNQQKPTINSPTANKSTKESPSTPSTPQEKVVIFRQGDKIIKKITSFETWHVIDMKNSGDEVVSKNNIRNQLQIPLVKLANACRNLQLPSNHWNCKVSLQELSPVTLAKSHLITYTGDLEEHNIDEKDRHRYQPSCVMFRRTVNDRDKTRLPYDRAVIFKNKTFFTNIDGKNVKLVAAPNTINTLDEIELLIDIVDSLTLDSEFVEQATTIQ